MAVTANVKINKMFDDMTTQLSQAANSVKDKIDKAIKAGDLDPMKMLQVQFQMGNYNALVEAASSVTKGLTDTAKTLAQRAGG
ncbi:EscF/YscF/HrpA family type III secretion system needle major subunit [Desulfocurvus sp. DL9XJH121]